MMPESAAYGGPGWSPRDRSMREEIGALWGECGIASEYTRLRRVLLHRPAIEVSHVKDANAAQMFERPKARVAQHEHDALAETYRSLGVDVTYVEPDCEPPPNLMFVADLMFMTPAGAIVGRPASTVRAGEERWIARRLADLGIPVLRTITGHAVFEGADAMWLDEKTVMVGRGLRTNEAGAAQVAATLAEQDVKTIVVEQPHGTMHLMGQIRIVDRDLVYVRAHAVTWPTIDALRAHGYEVRYFPDDHELVESHGANFVVVEPRRIVMPSGNPKSEAAYRDAGIECITVDMYELRKAAGAVGCLTGVLQREMA